MNGAKNGFDHVDSVVLELATATFGSVHAAKKWIAETHFCAGRSAVCFFSYSGRKIQVEKLLYAIEDEVLCDELF